MSISILEKYSDIDGIERHICHDAFSHAAINNFLKKRKMPSHEFIFNKLLTLKVMEDENIAEEFIAFQETYFKEYEWRKNYFNMRDAVLIESNFCDNILRTMYYDDYYNEEHYDRTHKFGEIATEFFIRCYSYSLITKDVRKVILTSEQNCSKVFKDYLEDGYSIQKLQKRIYVRNPYDLFGEFISLPALPTNTDNLSCDIQEFIEDRHGELIKVLKY